MRRITTFCVLVAAAGLAHAQPVEWSRHVELVSEGVKSSYGLSVAVVEGEAPKVRVNPETMTIEVSRGALTALDRAARSSANPEQVRRMGLGRMVEETAGMVRQIEPHWHAEGVYRAGLIERILRGAEPAATGRITHNYRTEISTLNAALANQSVTVKVVDGAKPEVRFVEGTVEVSRGALATLDAEAARSAEPKVFRRATFASLVRGVVQSGTGVEQVSGRALWNAGVQEIAKTGRTPPKTLESTHLHRWSRPDIGSWDTQGQPKGLKHAPQEWHSTLRTVDAGLRVNYEMRLEVVPLRASNNDVLQVKGNVVEVSEAWLRRNAPNAQAFFENVARRVASVRGNVDPVRLREHIAYEGTLRELIPRWRSLPVIPWNGFEEDIREPKRRYANRDAYESWLRANYRKPNGTMDYAALHRDKVFKEVGGFARFGMALFLQEIAAVAATGDRRQIDAFFDYLLTTDFYKHYGLFVAGARVTEVAYTKFLQRYVKPRFVNGLLKTNLALAAGMALPLIVEGQFEGRAFVISLASLGLSSSLVQGAVRGLTWVKDLRQARKAGTLATVGKNAGRLARLGGWFYTVAELAVILTVAEKLDAAATDYLDNRDARGTLAEAGQDFLAAVGRDDATPESVGEALDAYHDAWSGYRNFLYRPLEQEDALFASRVAKLARRAKVLADQRGAMVERLQKHESLRLRALADHGTLDAYAEHLAQRDAERLQAEADRELSDTNARREELLAEVYEAPRRDGPFLEGADDLDWHLRGAVKGAAHDPGAQASVPVYARLTRSRSRDAFTDRLRDVSRNRLQGYEDEAELYQAVADRLRADGRDDLADVVETKRALTILTLEADRRLAGGQALIDTAGMNARLEAAGE